MSRYRNDVRAHGQKLIRCISAVMMVLTVMFAGVTMVQAKAKVVRISAGSSTSLQVSKGKPLTVRTSAPFYEIVIGDPEIANVSPLTDKSFYILGISYGATGIALFDKDKQLVGTINVDVTPDTNELAKAIRKAVPGTDVNVSSANGMLVLSGSADDAVAAEKARSIASNLSGEDKVINSVNITSSQQVQLNVRFVEINRQVGKELGTEIGATYVGSGGGFFVQFAAAGQLQHTGQPVVG